MGKETISSQELSDYTHVNSTQIRRDLSGFGKFGKRGVGYNVDSLVSQIRKILRTAGQHNIALFGAGHLGKAIASSDIFADHGFRVVAIFDTDAAKVGEQVGGARRCATPTTSRRVVEEEDIVVGVLAVPTAGRPGARRRARRRRREDHLQLLRGAAAGAARGDGPHLEPRRRPALRALLLPDLIAQPLVTIDLDARASSSRPRPTSPSASRRSSRSSTRTTLDLVPRFEELRDAAAADPVLADVDRRRADLLGDRDPLRPRRGLRRRASRRQRDRRRRLFALAAEHGVALGATGTHPWADYREQHIIDTEHYRRVEDGLKYVAWRNNTFSLHVHVGVQRRRPRRARVRPPAPGAAAAAGDLGQLAVPRRARPRPALGPHPDLHAGRSRAAAIPDAFGGWAAFADYVEFLVAHELDRRVHAGVVVGAPAPRVRHRRGAHLRRPDHARPSPRRWPALIVACVAQAARDDRRGRARSPTCPAA